jgi:hypothetical protein
MWMGSGSPVLVPPPLPLPPKSMEQEILAGSFTLVVDDLCVRPPRKDLPNEAYAAANHRRSSRCAHYTVRVVPYRRGQSGVSE